MKQHEEMVETAESDVQIILSIKEGRGFEQVLQPTSLTGTLNGHCLETDKIDSSSNPQYATDLVWETDKPALRKMRSGQTPLKLECFAFKEGENKERIGFVLLSVRSAQVTSGSRNLSPKAHWHKLSGLRNDLKIHKPELLLTLIVEERKAADTNTTAEIRNSAAENDTVFQNDKLVPYLHPGEQLIQLGPIDSCCKLFLLSIEITHVEGLHHLLLPECLNRNTVVRFSYRILENDIELKSFKIDETHLSHEKVIVRIRSSLIALKYYLRSKPHLSIFLKHGNSTVAESLINLQSLVPTDNLQEFLKCNANASITLQERCYPTKVNLTEKPATNQHEKSYFDIEFKLQYVGSKTDVETDIIHNPDTSIIFKNVACNNQYYNEEKTDSVSQKCSEIESHRNPSGDARKFNSANIFSETKCATECKYVNKQATDSQCLKNQSDKITRLRSCHYINKNYINDIGPYHCYCLHISLLAITFISPKLSERQIQFRFHHPKSEDISTAHTTSIVCGEKSKLQNIGCQFNFISAPDEIRQLLQSFPPKISIYNTNENSKPLLFLTLDVGPLFHQDKLECQYELSLYDTDGNEIGDIDVMLKLEDHGPHFMLRKEIASKNLGPPILDDSLAYKIVDELETWKERQKEMFKAELKRKEERHLNMLSDEWQRQRENLESKLSCSVEQCKVLADSLNNATENLKTRRLKNLENETRLIKANEDLKWRYETKLQELKDSLCTMQNEFTSKVTKLEEKRVALEAQVEILMYENENLKSSMSKQTDELQMYQKGSLTQDQTTSLLQEVKLLQEKLDNVQKGKSFFKEQWGKAVRELHRIKVDHQQTMQVQIKNSKEELKSADLAEILSTDTKALTNDQILLNELQKEINVIKPKQSFASKETYSEVFTPVDNMYPKVSYNVNKTLSAKPEECNERLQTLREERDSLLRTGSYAADDVVIKKLNTEIQSLLVSR